MSYTALKISGQLIILAVVCFARLYVCVMKIRTLFISEEFIKILNFYSPNIASFFLYSHHEVPINCVIR